MKTIRCILALAILPLVLLVGCGKEQRLGDGSRVLVSFSVSSPVTKAAVSVSGETRVESLDLLCFSAADGVLDCHVRAVSESLVEAKVTAGMEVHWYVVANAPLSAGLSTFATESEFLSSEVLLTDNSSSLMVMMGSGVSTFTVGDNLVEDIGVDRYACKVSVVDVSVPWLADFSTPPACVVDRIVLMNARGGCPWSGIPTGLSSDLWYNKSQDSASSGFLGSCLKWTGSVSVVDGVSSSEVGAVLYCMPNPSSVAEFADDVPWAPRKTRVAVRATIGGVPQWYAIDLPSMSCNHHYIVSELVLLGPGTASPDMDVDRTAIAFNVEVVEWSDNTVEGGTFPVQL